MLLLLIFVGRASKSNHGYNDCGGNVHCLSSYSVDAG